MRPATYSLLILVCILLIGCGSRSRVQHRLDEAENLIDAEEYQKALVILDSIQLLSDKSRADETLTNLLWIRAKDKIGDFMKNDSLINKVMEYYIEGNHSPERHAMVYYYAGRTNAELQNRIKALQYFQKALDCLKKYEDLDLQSYVHCQMGRILTLSGLYKSALNHYKKEYDCEVKKGNMGEAFDTNLSIAYVLRCIGEIDSARNIYSELERILPTVSTPQRQEAYTTQLLTLLISNAKYEEADSIVNAQSLRKDSIMHRSLLNLLNYIDRYKGDSVSVKKRSIQLLSDDLLSENDIYSKLSAAENLSEIYLDKGNIAKAIQYTKLFHNLTKTIKKTEATTALAEMEAIYDYSESERENNLLKEENRRKRNVILWLSVALSILILITASSILAFKLWRTRIKLHQEEALREADRIIQDRSDESMRLYNELTALKESIAKADNAPEETPGNKEILDALHKAKRMEQQINLSAVGSEIIKKATSVDGKLTDEDFINLEKALSELYPNLISTLRDMNLSQRNFRDSLLITIKMPVKICANVFNVTPQAISTSRNRLFKKYAPGSDKKDWTAYLQSFCEGQPPQN